MVTSYWRVIWLFLAGVEDNVLATGNVGFMVTCYWGRGWIIMLLPAGVESNALPAGKVGFMVTSYWGQGGSFGYSPLGERVMFFLLGK